MHDAFFLYSEKVCVFFTTNNRFYIYFIAFSPIIHIVFIFYSYVNVIL